MYNNSNNNTLLYTDTDIGQVTFDANAPEPQNNSFLFKITDNEIALEVDKLFTLGIRDPTVVDIAEPSQMNITVVDGKNGIYGRDKYYIHALKLYTCMYAYFKFFATIIYLLVTWVVCTISLSRFHLE